MVGSPTDRELPVYVRRAERSRFVTGGNIRICKESADLDSERLPQKRLQRHMSFEAGG